MGVEYNMDEVDEKFYRDTMQVLSQKENKSDENNRKCTELGLKQSVTSWKKPLKHDNHFCLWTPATFYRTRSCRRTLWISLKVQ